MHDGYEISTSPDRLDLDVIHGFLRDAYWSRGIPREVAERAITNSIPFGLYAPTGDQAGFARVVTDRAVHAYIADVFVLPQHRGRGLAKALIRAILEHPELQGMRRIQLHTLDAHDLYAALGFTPPVAPERIMEIAIPTDELYGRG